MEIDSPMSDNVYREFNESSIRVVWEILRKFAIPKLLDNNYCPVPFVETPQNYDMFNVYMKSQQKLVDKAKNVMGLPSQLCYVGKLGDFLEYPSPQDKQTMAMTSSIIYNKSDKLVPKFRFHTKSADMKKEFTLQIENARIFHSNINFTVSKAHLKAGSVPVFKEGVHVVTNVCAADSVDININTQFRGTHNEQKWHLIGPIPIAIRLTKLDVGRDGVVNSQKHIPVADIVEQYHWLDFQSRKLQHLEECKSLLLHLQGDDSNVTLRTRSLYNLLP